MPFSALGLSLPLSQPLASLGYARPTPIQSASIPLVLAGRDLLARAATGTGKTAAFGLPVIDRLVAPGARRAAGRGPRALVLVPTRELAAQVHSALRTYGKPAGLRTAVVFGGVPVSRQARDLRRGIDLLVATPGRLLDLVDQRVASLASVEILTLDEADRMLDMGFLPQLKRVLALLPRDRQTLLFSATLSAEIVRLSAAFTRSPERVDLSEGAVVAATVHHIAHPVPAGRKGDLLRHVLHAADGSARQALIFCRTKRGSNRVGEALGRAGFRAAVIHGNKSQSARTRALADFAAGRATVLVATDLAARGLDIPQLPLVVNYDLPLVPEDYVHRIGRTGRAGRAGRAVSLVEREDAPLLRDIQRLLPAPVEQVIVDGFDPGTPPVAVVAGPRPRRPRPGRSRFRPRRTRTAA